MHHIIHVLVVNIHTKMLRAHLASIDFAKAYRQKYSHGTVMRVRVELSKESQQFVWVDIVPSRHDGAIRSRHVLNCTRVLQLRRKRTICYFRLITK